MLNTFGFDPCANVLKRSPLAQKKKFPSGLRRSLALLDKALAGHGPPSEPLSDWPSEEGAALPDMATAPPPPSPLSLRCSTGSFDDFQDALDDSPPRGDTPTVPPDVLAALGKSAPQLPNIPPPPDVLDALAKRGE